MLVFPVNVDFALLPLVPMLRLPLVPMLRVGTHKTDALRLVPLCFAAFCCGCNKKYKSEANG